MATGFSLDSLNKAQFEAVRALHGPVLILAGAGTGKTRTVTCRISALIENGIKAENILAVTFTNKSANEMRERVVGMIGKKKGKDTTVSTFHSLCLKILRRDIESVGYGKNFAILAGGDQTGLIRQLIVKKGGAKCALKPMDVMSEISKAKNAERSLDSIADELIASIAIAYHNELRAQNAIDFDDLLLLAEKVLREHEHIRDHWRNQFSHITVDEFQDTNSLQMRLLKQLVGPHHNICVVGDDDQSIYGWRGAEVANILQFERHYPNPVVIRLEENYRSTEAILTTANSLIRNNTGRREKQLRPTISGGDPVRLVAMPGEDEEAEWVTEEILGQKKNDTHWEDFAILFRTNSQTRKVEVALRERKIPYRMVGAQSFYDRREVRDLLAYVQLLVNPEIDIPLLRILNTPPRGIGQNTAIAAVEHAREHQQSLWKTLIDPRFCALLSSRALNAINQFIALIENAQRDITDGTNPGVVIDRLMREIEFIEWLMRQCKTDNEKDQRREAIGQALSDITTATKSGQTLAQFLDRTTLDSEKEDTDLEKKTGVTLITLHAAKGLEFPVVYLVGLEEGILPHKRSIEEGTRDEERRLLYVGITRAKKNLNLSYCAFRTKWGEQTHCEMSSFLKELDPEWLSVESYDDLMNQPASDDDLSSFFNSMDDFLS